MIPRIGFRPGWGVPPGGNIEGHRRGFGDISAQDAKEPPSSAAAPIVAETELIQHIPLPKNPDRPLDDTIVPGWE